MLHALAFLTLALRIASAVGGLTCSLKPLGSGLDDTDQVGAPSMVCRMKNRVDLAPQGRSRDHEVRAVRDDGVPGGRV